MSIERLLSKKSSVSRPGVGEDVDAEASISSMAAAPRLSLASATMGSVSRLRAQARNWVSGVRQPRRDSSQSPQRRVMRAEGAAKLAHDLGDSVISVAVADGGRM